MLWIRQPNSPSSAILHIDAYDETGTFHGGADIATVQAVQEMPSTDILISAEASGLSFEVSLEL